MSKRTPAPLMFALLCLAFLTVSDVQAQHRVRLYGIVPTSPLTGEVITAQILYPAQCFHEAATTVSGVEIRTDVLLVDCDTAGGPPPFDVGFEESFGPLAPGSYTYRLFYREEGDPNWTLSTATTIVVAAPVPAVPALSGTHLMLLALSLSLGAVMILRRVGP